MYRLGLNIVGMQAMQTGSKAMQGCFIFRDMQASGPQATVHIPPGMLHDHY